MIICLLIYLGLCASVLPLIDLVRIKLDWGVKGNIDHAISGIIATIAACGVLYIYAEKWVHETHRVWWLVGFIIGCIGDRLLVYSPALNIFRREKLTYMGTGNWTDRHFSFKEQRLIGVVFIIVALIINSVI